MIMTSATWPEGVRRLASTYMKDPFMVYIGTLDLRACSDVRQKIEIVDQDDKRRLLDEFLNQRGPKDKTLVFFGRKAVVDDVASSKALMGQEVHCLHGGHSQDDRENSLQEFRDGVVRIAFYKFIIRLF